MRTTFGGYRQLIDLESTFLGYAGGLVPLKADGDYAGPMGWKPSFSYIDSDLLHAVVPNAPVQGHVAQTLTTPTGLIGPMLSGPILNAPQTLYATADGQGIYAQEPGDTLINNGFNHIDLVSYYQSAISHCTINVTGGGIADRIIFHAKDTVTVDDTSVVIFGDGDASHDDIFHLGNGNNTVWLQLNDKLNAGNGNNTIYAGGGLDAASNNSITLGDGNNTWRWARCCWPPTSFCRCKSGGTCRRG